MSRDMQIEERKPCRKCGSEDIISTITANANTSRFIHVIRRCYKCGEWLGGRTFKKHTKEIISK